jgi:hypothetical protein
MSEQNMEKEQVEIIIEIERRIENKCDHHPKSLALNDIDLGLGCQKDHDLNGTGLMLKNKEDEFLYRMDLVFEDLELRENCAK